MVKTKIITLSDVALKSVEEIFKTTVFKQGYKWDKKESFQTFSKLEKADTSRL